MHPFFRPYSVRIPSGLIHHMEYSARRFPSPSFEWNRVSVLGKNGSMFAQIKNNLTKQLQSSSYTAFYLKNFEVWAKLLPIPSWMPNHWVTNVLHSRFGFFNISLKLWWGINSEIIHQNGCLIWLKKPTGWRGRIRTCPPGMALIINHFFILHALHKQEGRKERVGKEYGEKGNLQKWMTPRGWTDFVPKMFHLFTQPHILNHFFILHRQEGRSRGRKWEKEKTLQKWMTPRS